MVSRKLERLISPGKWIHNLSVLSLSILSAGIFFFVLSESVTYLIFRDKIKDYTSDVLVRSESLLVQTESVKTAAKSHLNIGDSPCTNENILHLRVVVWPYPLIKDVGYIIKGELACSALWGSLRPTLSLNILIKNGLRGKECGFLVLSLWMIYPSMDIFLKVLW